MRFEPSKNLSTEWSFANGHNSYASGTVSGPNTRREHATLAVEDEAGVRWVLVNHLEEWLSISGRSFPLSSTIYFDHNASGNVTIYPQGYRMISNFTDDPYPRWTYNIEGYALRREIRPARGGGILVEYSIEAINGSSISLSVRPMISGRKAGDLHFENRSMQIEGTYLESEKKVELQPYRGVPGFAMTHSEGAAWSAKPLWYRRVRLISDQRDEESLMSPGEFVFPLSPDSPAWLRLSPNK